MGNRLSTHTEASTKLITAHQAHHCDDHARSQNRDKVSLPKPVQLLSHLSHLGPGPSGSASGVGVYTVITVYYYANLCGGRG